MNHAHPALPPIDKTSLAHRHGRDTRPESLRPEILPDKLPPVKGGHAWPKAITRQEGTMIYYWQNWQTFWMGGARITFNGCPRAYHPADEGSFVPLGEERLAGFPSLVRGEHGLAVQTQRDPAPGFLVSRTAYQRLDYPPTDPRRYVDARQVAYLAVPMRLMLCAFEKGFPPILGCKALIWDLDRAYYHTVPVCDISHNGTALSERVFRDWSLGHRYDSGITGNVMFKLFPGVPQEGYELQDWRPE